MAFAPAAEPELAVAAAGRHVRAPTALQPLQPALLRRSPAPSLSLCLCLCPSLSCLFHYVLLLSVSFFLCCGSSSHFCTSCVPAASQMRARSRLACLRAHPSPSGALPLAVSFFVLSHPGRSPPFCDGLLCDSPRCVLSLHCLPCICCRQRCRRNGAGDFRRASSRRKLAPIPDFLLCFCRLRLAAIAPACVTVCILHSESHRASAFNPFRRAEFGPPSPPLQPCV